MRILKNALLGNGIFSLCSALVLILFKNRFAIWFGLDKSLAFLLVGLGLLYFSYTIYKELKNPNSKAVRFIIIQDFVWVLASIIILVFKPFGITALGHQIIAGVALVVFIFGIGQTVGLARTDLKQHKGYF